MKSITFILPLVLFIGCFASGPDPIKDALLVDKTDAQTTKLDKIEKLIVKISDDKRQLEKNYSVIKQQISIVDDEIDFYKSLKKVLLGKQKLYTMTKDGDKMNKTKIELNKCLTNIKYKQVEAKYFEAKSDDTSAHIELKDAELGEKVSERRYMRAKIARAYQEKVYGGKKKAPKGAKLIKVKTYEDDLNDKKKVLFKQREKRIKTQTLLKAAEMKLKNTEKV